MTKPTALQWLPQPSTVNSTGGDRGFEAIAMLAQAAGRPLNTLATPPSVLSGAPGDDQSPPCREVPEKTTNDRISGQG